METRSYVSKTQETVRRVLIIGGSIFMLAMFYGSGMRGQVKKLQKQYEQVKIYRQEARLAQLTAQARDAQLQQLEARRLLDVAGTALQQGDTAAAKNTIAEAITRLRTASTVDAATTADLNGITDDLANLSLENRDAARLSLDGFAHAMDEKFTQSGSIPAPDALTPVTITPPTDNDKPTLGNDVTRVK
jgi:multidrug efflux pump subunit AcrA (membrane-fusion protein)